MIEERRRTCQEEWAELEDRCLQVGGAQWYIDASQHGPAGLARDLGRQPSYCGQTEAAEHPRTIDSINVIGSFVTTNHLLADSIPRYRRFRWRLLRPSATGRRTPHGKGLSGAFSARAGLLMSAFA